MGETGLAKTEKKRWTLLESSARCPYRLFEVINKEKWIKQAIHT
ncbi:MAG: hypothetical protein ACO1OC_10340 [Tuberibacillus sp.]